MEKVAKIIATYFGLGLSSKAPGTVGSLGTLPLVAAAAYFPNHRERVHGHRCLRKANHGEHYIKIKAELTRAERCHGEARRRRKQAYAYQVAAAYLCAYHADGYIRCAGCNGCNHKAGGRMAEPAGPCGGGIACEERCYGIVAQEPKADGGKY